MTTTTSPQGIRVSFRQAVGILLPYSWHHISEQVLVVVPVCLYLALFQLTVLQRGLAQVTWIVGASPSSSWGWPSSWRAYA